MVLTKTSGRPKQDPEPRRQEILSAAIRVFAKNGYHNTEVKRIAEVTGIAKGTVYLYFQTKQDLFMAVVTHAVESLAERIDAEVQGAAEPVEKIKAVVRAYFRFFDEEGALVEILTQERTGSFRRAEQAYCRMFAKNAWRLEKIIREGVAQGTFRPLKPRQSARILANLLTGTIYSHVTSGHTSRASSATKAVTDFLLHGMLAQEKKT